MVWTRRAQHRLDWWAKLIVVAQKRPDRSKNTWDEVLVDDRKKLGMNSADHQNRFEWGGQLRGRLSTKTNPQ